MKINEKYFIGQTRGTNEITTNIFNGVTKTITATDANYSAVHNIICTCRKRLDSNETKNKKLIRLYKIVGFSDSEIAERLFDTTVDSSTDTSAHKKIIDTESKKAALNKLIDFFSEFRFTPSLRFTNTLVRSKKPADYVKNYFMVQDHQYAMEINDKIKSPEFDGIIRAIRNREAKCINSRFKLYFGEPGTGKTTQAIKEADSVIICASDMLPADLMQNFAFSDGKAEFQKSDLWIAMEEGKTIVLDEMNMLPFESLRWLQGVLDGKSTFSFKGFDIKIHENFQVIGTMNLNVNGQCIPLPAPLIDRCSEIKEFDLDASLLLSAVM